MTSAPVRPTQPTDPSDSAAIRLVVVDDSDEVRLLARLALDGTDGLAVVAEAADGAAGLDVVERTRPDVVVLDVAMPVMDGLQTLTELRRRHPELPVVMFSGFSESHLADRALSLGAAAYVEKSGDLDALTTEIRRAAGSPPL